VVYGAGFYPGEVYSLLATYDIGRDKFVDTNDDGVKDTWLTGSGLPLKKPVIVGSANHRGSFKGVLRGIFGPGLYTLEAFGGSGTTATAAWEILEDPCKLDPRPEGTGFCDGDIVTVEEEKPVLYAGGASLSVGTTTEGKEQAVYGAGLRPNEVYTIMATYGMGKNKFVDTNDDGVKDTWLTGSGLPLKKPVIVGSAGETGAFKGVVRGIFGPGVYSLELYGGEGSSATTHWEIVAK
jgi:hypothetical protein